MPTVCVIEEKEHRKYGVSVPFPASGASSGNEKGALSRVRRGEDVVKATSRGRQIGSWAVVKVGYPPLVRVLGLEDPNQEDAPGRSK